MPLPASKPFIFTFILQLPWSILLLFFYVSAWTHQDPSFASPPQLVLVSSFSTLKFSTSHSLLVLGTFQHAVNINAIQSDQGRPPDPRRERRQRVFVASPPKQTIAITPGDPGQTVSSHQRFAQEASSPAGLCGSKTDERTGGRDRCNQRTRAGAAGLGEPEFSVHG